MSKGGVAVCGAALVAVMLTTWVWTAAGAPDSLRGSEDAKARVRLGVFESRAIAVAFANSKLNTVAAELTEEFKKAEAAGDQRLMEQLRRKGELRQERLHRQGFGRALVDDLLEPIREQLADVSARTGVDAIVAGVVVAGPNVDSVDVTDALLALYDPSDRTLKMIKELRKQPPLSDEEISHDH